MPDVVVIGAGISGLACARRLQKSGLDVLVLESGDRPGGVIRSHNLDGYLVESGPNSILPTPSSMAEIQDAGIADDLVTAPPKSPRFVYLGGRLRRVPWVLSPPGIARAMLEPLISRGPGNESAESFFTRRFGSEVHDRLAAPFVGGIYAGDTADLSLDAAFPRIAAMERSYGSVVMGMLRSRRQGPRYGLASFKRGMSTLPQGLAKGLDIRFDSPVSKLTPGWKVAHGMGGNDRTEARSVVLAVPAYTGASLLEPASAGMAELLNSVWYAPIVVAALSVPDDGFSSELTGFGVLIPRTEGLQVLGTLFSSSLFPGRSPDGRALLTCFLGGAQSRDVVNWSDDQIWDVVTNEIETVLSIRAGTATPVRLFRHRRAIPQYQMGHLELQSGLATKVNELPGLFLTGSYIDGVSVPGSMDQGVRTADAAIQYLSEA